MEYRVLGPLEVIDSGQIVALGGHKQRTVLAILLLHANEVVSSDALTEAIWGESPPSRARATLQVYIANLRRFLDSDGRSESRLARQPSGYRLRTVDDEVDLDRFHELIEDGQVALARRDPMRASILLRAALELWRGPAFPDLVDHPGTIAAVTQLDEERLNALEYRVEADLDAGRAEQLVTELQAAVTAHPLRERLRAQLILALYRTGQPAEALAACQSARTMMLEELGMDPGADLQELERAILQQDPALDPVSPGRSRPTLPVAATELIGRDRELAELTALVEDVRLVTLLGAGGSGKSRLGLEFATLVEREFDDGAFYVSLAALTDPLLVLPAIASALGVRETAERPLHELLVDRLGDQHALLVLDNFEQLLPAAGHIAELINRTHHLTILATSRAPLHVSGEHEYLVEPLTLPRMDPLPPVAALRENPAVRLFIDRSRLVDPDFDPADGDIAIVAAICHRLDGLPLAIELAAARSRVLPPTAILTRLDERLRLLTGGPRDVQTKQQTLRASIQWSYELLDPEERHLFERLAVFRGGCALDAVGSVCVPDGGDSLELLERVDSLVSQSLLQRRLGADGAVRFVMLETIHEFAEELLDSLPEDSVRRRHAEFFAALAEAAAPRLTGRMQLEWLARLNSEHDNLRAVLTWSTGQDGDRGIALRIAGSLWHFWEMSGNVSEGRRWLETVLACAEGTPELRLAVVSGAATMAWAAGDQDRATRLHEDALCLARELGDLATEAFSLIALGTLLVDRECYDEAEELDEQALALALKVGESRTAAMARHNTAEVAFHRGEYALAAERYEEALQAFRELDEKFGVVASLHGLAMAVLRRGDRGRAAKALREALSLALRVGENFWLAASLGGLGVVAEDAQQPLRAVRLLSSADAMRRRIGSPIQPSEQADYETLLKALRAQLGEGAFERAWESGQCLTLEQAVEEGSEL